MIENEKSEQLVRGVPYPLGDPLGLDEERRFGVTRQAAYIARQPGPEDGSTAVMGIWNGEERRPPKKGEWFLSGAKIACYCARADLKTEFHIAQLVRVRRVSRLVIEEVTP